MNKYFRIIAQGNVAQILFYGFIGPWDKINAIDIVSELARLEAEGFTRLNVRVNTNGGDVFEGNTIYNALKRTKMELFIFIDGVAASMGILFLALPNAVKVTAAANAKGMLHQPEGGVQGDAETMRDGADMLDDLTKDFVAAIAKSTGKTKAQVKSLWFQRGKDTWLNAEQMLAEGLIHEIEDDELDEPAPTNANVKDAHNYYSQYYSMNPTNENNNIMNQKELAVKLGLNENATVTEINAKVEANIAAAAAAEEKPAEEKPAEEKPAEEKPAEEKPADDSPTAKLEKEVTQMKTRSAETLVDGAIEAKKILTGDRDTWVGMAVANYDNTKKAIDGLSPAMSVSDITDHGTGEGGKKEVNPADRSTWTIVEYQNDGSAQALKAENPDLYNSLYEKHFKVKAA